MAQPPQFLTLRDSRDRPARVEIALRRLLLVLITLVLVAGLFNLFGQRERASRAFAPAATFSVSASDRLRGGLFYQGRFTIEAKQEIDHATIVLDRGWTEGMHINTIEPAPVGESSRDGRLALDMGHVAAGDRVILFMQFQVNPTNVGKRSQDVELYDGETLLAHIDRTVRVFP